LNVSDISNIQGTDPVASMVCFVNGKPQRSEYRRFRIRSKQTPMILRHDAEAVAAATADSSGKQAHAGVLILIDGCKAHLNAALEALQWAGITDQPVIALGQTAG
jgi:excinuclease ABC subunit C